MSPGRNILILGARTSKTTEPRVVEMRGTHSPSRALEVLVNGATPAFTPQFPDLCILVFEEGDMHTRL